VGWVLGLTGEVDVEPVNDRVLVFFSDVIVHEVLPVVGEEKRMTLTLWIPTDTR
jgi:Rps23 Pro-64 3,4-dihydroxylase Tpa1-like proline 4-hydroxylase